MQNMPIRVLNRYRVIFMGFGYPLAHAGRETHPGWKRSALPQSRATPLAIHPPIEDWDIPELRRQK